MAACEVGDVCILGDGSLPEVGDATREVRADVLRYLIVGGCKKYPVADWGVSVNGAYVSGSLDLSFASAKGLTSLSVRRFQNSLKMLQTSLEFLNLSGSHLIELNAQGARITGDVFLRNIIATATITFAGAEIGGQLDCTGAQLNATTDHALNAQGTKIADCVFFRGLKAKAQVNLSGASIGGLLDCTNARFKAEDVDALHMQRLNVVEGLLWHGVTVEKGTVDLASAHVGDLVDDPQCWPENGRLYLDGFTYDRISSAPTDAKTRIAWLEKGSTWNGEFFPQPFTQLAKVMRELGHDGEARKVLFKREQLLRRNVRDQKHITPNGDISVGLHSIWRDIKNGFRYSIDLLLRGVVGYGHHPFQSLWLLIALIFLAIVPAHYAYEEGSFAPNSGPILASADWQDYANTPGNPAERWSADGAPGQDWETFNRYAYAADLVIPIIDLGQTSAWAPSTTRGWWGKQLWWARWVFITLGWIVTALGAAAITGLIRRD